MEDAEIVRLFFARSEQALRESKTKYGAACRRLAMRVLGSREDAEETENDTYLRAWNTIPPAEPQFLGAYLASVCRRLSIDRLRAAKRQKRGGGVYVESLAELDDTVADCSADFADAAALTDALNRFLETLPPETRTVFLRRYWWCLTVKEIAEAGGMSQSAVKMSLSRTRQKLRAYLEGEG